MGVFPYLMLWLVFRDSDGGYTPPTESVEDDNQGSIFDQFTNELLNTARNNFFSKNAFVSKQKHNQGIFGKIKIQNLSGKGSVANKVHEFKGPGV